MQTSAFLIIFIFLLKLYKKINSQYNIQNMTKKRRKIIISAPLKKETFNVMNNIFFDLSLLWKIFIIISRTFFWPKLIFYYFFFLRKVYLFVHPKISISSNKIAFFRVRCTNIDDSRHSLLNQ